MHGESSAFAKGELDLSNPVIVHFGKNINCPKFPTGSFALENHRGFIPQ
jgi:hypothetical protein